MIGAPRNENILTDVRCEFQIAAHKINEASSNKTNIANFVSKDTTFYHEKLLKRPTYVFVGFWEIAKVCIFLHLNRCQ